jgi:GT2 family glycosyltransferase
MLHGAWAHDVARDVDWAVGAALLMRRDAINELGGFDERLFMYAEDLDWCWRARSRGWTVRFEPRAIVRHVGNASGQQHVRVWRNRTVWRNTYRVYRWRRGLLPTTAYRVANLLGTSRACWTWRRNQPVRAHFRRELRAHLSSTRGSDRPPGGA